MMKGLMNEEKDAWSGGDEVKKSNECRARDEDE
jgi:hypothetical protein